ncbi:MAG TPA: hypothetical protein VKI44_44090, partial [Acetobacteraceae bacterium]|nr:hypothetical protein [Acetobacteraceae bacterium]
MNHAQLLGAGTGLDDLDPRIVRQIGELGRRYDAGDLRRFARPKRDALVAWAWFKKCCFRVTSKIARAALA